MCTGARMAGISIICAEVMSPRGLLGLAKDTLEFSTAEIHSIIQLLSSSSSYPILVHCTQGKDRTGLIVILVLLLCGVDRAVIANDYMASERELLPLRDQRLRETRAIGLGDEFAGCQSDFVDGIVGFLEERWGGVGGYLQSLGFEQEVMSRVKENLMIEDWNETGRSLPL